MTERDLVAAARIRQELADLERIVARAERTTSLARNSTEHVVFLDPVALNLHNFYGGLERVFRHIAADRNGWSCRESFREGQFKDENVRNPIRLG